jgi:glucokinase
MESLNGKTVGLVGLEASNHVMRAVKLGADGALAAVEELAVNHAAERLPQIVDFIKNVRSVFGDFARIGLAVPGLIEKASQRVAYSAHIPEHARGDLADEIFAATGVRATVENDANAAAYGEFRLGSGRGSSNLFYATLGEGVGGAFIIDGQIWRGSAGFAGEFGYVTINSDGMRLEEVASTANIVRRTRQRFHQDHTSSLGRLDEQRITISDIVTAAGRGDDFAQTMLQRTGTYVGTGIATVINLFNVERVVVGGEIMRAADVVLEGIIRRARELSFSPSFNSTSIVAGELNENAAAIGAAILAATET